MNVEQQGARCALGSLVVGFGLCMSPLGLAQQPAQPQPGQQAQQGQAQQGQQAQQPQQGQQAQQGQAQQGQAQQAQQAQEGQQDVQIAAAAEQPQQAAMRWVDVRVVHVKGDRVAEFESLIKELSQAMADTNMPPMTVYQQMLGMQNVYHIVSPVQSLAEFDNPGEPPMEPAEMASWLNRIEGTIESHEHLIAQLHPDLSILPEGFPGAESASSSASESGSASREGGAAGGSSARSAAGAASATAEEAPELWMARFRTVLPGQREEYEGWLRDELTPALREAGTEALYVSTVAMGGDERTWVLVAPVESFAALEQSPVAQAVGQERFEEMIARSDAMLEARENVLLRLRNDLVAPQ